MEEIIHRYIFKVLNANVGSRVLEKTFTSREEAEKYSARYKARNSSRNYLFHIIEMYQDMIVNCWEVPDICPAGVR